VIRRRPPHLQPRRRAPDPLAYRRTCLPAYVTSAPRSRPPARGWPVRGCGAAAAGCLRVEVELELLAVVLVPSKVSAASEMGVSRQPTGLSGPSERERQRERRRGRPGGGASGPAGRLEDV